ncbi:MAG: hypothetical protein IT392_01425 [Nitrospirae bacterium]|nr:hypothetical protein [Nitrospirota bacterium]
MKLIYLIIGMLFMVTPVWGEQLSIPHKFSPGTPAKASEVNENFEAVEDAINNLNSGNIQTTTSDVLKNISFKKYENTEYDGVAAVSCPINMIAVSAGCTCDIATTGPIFALAIVGNGSVCGCYPSLLDTDFTTNKLDVNVVCAESTSTKAVSSVIMKKDVAYQWAEELRQKEEELTESRKMALEKLRNR